MAKGRVAPTRILVVEDDVKMRQVIVKALTNTDIEVDTATQWSEARTMLSTATREFDAAIIEESIEGGRGLTLVRELRAKRIRLPLVVVTRDSNWHGYAEAMGLGAAAYLPHPVNRARLVTAVEEAVRRPHKKKRKKEQGGIGKQTDEQ